MCRVDTWEVEQPAWLPTKLALDHLKEAVGDPALKVQLLCGADLLESFGTPGLWAPQDVSTPPHSSTGCVYIYHAMCILL